MFDKPGNHGDEGINILFGDGHVRFVHRNEAIQLLQQQGITVDWPE